MTLLKGETTARLDDLHRAGAEALGLLEDLETAIDDPKLRQSVAAHAEAQRRLLERAADLRRAHGDFPHAADPERSHIEAAGAFVRAVMLPGKVSAHYVESLLDAALAVQEPLAEALSLDLDAELRGVLESFERDNEAFIRELRSRLPSL